ncbi:MAG: flagellar assembly protein FliW [Acidaminobacteraceae bacterium]
MLIETEVVGQVEYLDDDIITFEEGIYGFGGMKKFILILNPVDEVPFHYLQSIEDHRLYFIVTSPFVFVKDYDFELSESLVEKMGIKSSEEIDIFSITVIPEDIGNTTINLKAPIIINRNNKRAKQQILAENYRYKQFVFKENKLEER